MTRLHLLARLVSHTASFRHVLATAENVLDQCISIEETTFRVCILCGASIKSTCRPFGAVEGGLDQGPASSDPVTITAVNKFVGAARKATLRCILSRRQPRDKP